MDDRNSNEQQGQAFAEMSDGGGRTGESFQHLIHSPITILVALVLVIGAGGWYLYTQYKSEPALPSTIPRRLAEFRNEPPVNHLIEGVPYYGIYNLVPDFSPLATMTATILRYWGDERISFAELQNALSDDRNAFPQQRNIDSMSGPIYGNRAKVFFTENGYDLVFISRVLGEANREEKVGLYINAIKHYIAQDIPVMVYQQEASDYLSEYNTNENPYTWRVVIGVFDDTQKVIVHDHLLGNNYEYTFPEFEELFTVGSGILVVSPPSSLEQVFQKPVAAPYPKRLEIMDSVGGGEIFHLAEQAKTFAFKADSLCTTGVESGNEVADEFVELHTESIRFRDEVINHSSFQLATPYFQLVNKMWKARSLMLIGNVTEGRRLLLEEVVPANQDLDKVPGLDFRTASYSELQPAIINGQMPNVWGLLMLSYRLHEPEKNLEKAIEVARKWLDIEPTNKAMQERLAVYLEDLENGSTKVRGGERYYYCMGGKDVIQ